MHPFGNKCCRKKPFNLQVLKSESVANPGERSRGDPHPLSLGLDDRPPPPLSEGLDLPLAINDNSDVLPLISSGLIHPRRGFYEGLYTGWGGEGFLSAFSSLLVRL